MGPETFLKDRKFCKDGVTSRSSANGLVLIDGWDGEIIKENKYVGTVYYELAGKLELCISVRVNTSKTKGTFVIAPKDVINSKTSFFLHIPYTFLSLETNCIPPPSL